MRPDVCKATDINSSADFRQVSWTSRANSPDGGVIVAGDWNVSRSALDTYPRLRTEEPHALARADLNARIKSDGFVDIWRERHPNERSYTWFNRRPGGSTQLRVDYVLVSADMVPDVRAAEILPRLPWSDHAPVMVEL